MNPTDEAYTVAMPWYGREDFQRLWEMTCECGEMPGDYDVWHAAAVKVMLDWLARGRTLQIVSVKPDALLAWLEARGLPNTPSARVQYVQDRAKQASRGRGGIGIA